MTKMNLYLFILLIGFASCNKDNVEPDDNEILYVMPEETAEHEGT